MTEPDGSARARFYLEHRDAIEEWAALRSEGRDLIEAALFDLEDRLAALASGEGAELLVDADEFPALPHPVLAVLAIVAGGSSERRPVLGAASAAGARSVQRVGLGRRMGPRRRLPPSGGPAERTQEVADAARLLHIRGVGALALRTARCRRSRPGRLRQRSAATGRSGLGGHARRRAASPRLSRKPGLPVTLPGVGRSSSGVAGQSPGSSTVSCWSPRREQHQVRDVTSA